MKRYPYTDSTDIVIYNQKEKKPKKPKTWVACLSSAVAASLLTCTIFGVGFSNVLKNQQNTQTTGQNQQSVSMVSTNNALTGGEMTVSQIAAKVGRVFSGDRS